MGASEKRGSAYHGYTPEVADIREKYVYSRGNDGCREDESRTEFDRMITKVRAEAKAEALREAAENIHEIDGREDTMARRWLRARANQYKEGADNGR